MHWLSWIPAPATTYGPLLEAEHRVAPLTAALVRVQAAGKAGQALEELLAQAQAEAKRLVEGLA